MPWSFIQFSGLLLKIMGLSFLFLNWEVSLELFSGEYWLEFKIIIWIIRLINTRFKFSGLFRSRYPWESVIVIPSIGPYDFFFWVSAAWSSYWLIPRLEPSNLGFKFQILFYILLHFFLRALHFHLLDILGYPLILHLNPFRLPLFVLLIASWYISQLLMRRADNSSFLNPLYLFKQNSIFSPNSCFFLCWIEFLGRWLWFLKSFGMSAYRLLRTRILLFVCYSIYISYMGLIVLLELSLAKEVLRDRPRGGKHCLHHIYKFI